MPRLPPHCISFETKCVVKASSSPSLITEDPFLIKVPKHKAEELELRVGADVGVWMVSTSPEHPPHSPIWFLATVRELDSSLMLYIPQRTVKEEDLFDSEQVTVFLSPERKEESAEILNKYFLGIPL